MDEAGKIVLGIELGSDNISKQLKQIMKGLENDATEGLKHALKNIEGNAVSDLKNLGKTVEKETAATVEKAGSKVKETATAAVNNTGKSVKKKTSKTLKEVGKTVEKETTATVEKIGNKAKKSAANVVKDIGKNIKSKLSSSLKDVDKNLEKDTSSVLSGIGRKITTVIGIASLIKFSSECLELGSNLTEVQNVVDTTFTTMNNDLNAWAKNALKEFGLSETKAKNYAATLGAMSQSMGMTEKVAYDMGTAVSGLAGDVASFYNLDADDAYSKLKGIWTGETEALKSLGVVMTQTALDQYALNNGFGKTTAKMTEQEKLMLRYQYVTNALSKTTGDFAKTQDSWANQTRILQLRWESIKATLGQGLINVLTPVLKLINNLVERVSVLAERFSSFTAAVFGDASGGSNTLDSIADSANNTASGIDNITSSAIQATKELAGFDKINKLGTENVSSTGSTGSTGEQTGTSYGQQMTKRLTDSIGDINIGEVVKSFNEFIAKTIKEIDWYGIGNSIGEFLHSIDWLGIFASLVDIVSEALTGGFELWIGALEEAPIETALITTMALWKFTNLGKKVGDLVGGSIGSYTLKALVAAIGGYKIGNIIYEAISGEEIKMTMSEQIGYLLDYAFGSQDTSIITEQTQRMINAAMTEMSDALIEAMSLSDYSYIDELAEKYFALSQKKIFTNSDLDLLKQYRTELEKLGFSAPQYIDDMTNAWKGNKEAIDNATKEAIKHQKILDINSAIDKLKNGELSGKEAIEKLKKDMAYGALEDFSKLDQSTLDKLYDKASKRGWNAVVDYDFGYGSEYLESDLYVYKQIMMVEEQIKKSEKERLTLVKELFGVMTDLSNNKLYNMENGSSITGNSLKFLNQFTNYGRNKTEKKSLLNVDIKEAIKELSIFKMKKDEATKKKEVQINIDRSSATYGFNEFRNDIDGVIKSSSKKINKGFNAIKPKISVDTKTASGNIGTFVRYANRSLSKVNTSDFKEKLNELTKKRNISINFDKTSVIDKIKTFGSDVDRIVRETGNKGSLWSKTFANSIISHKSLVEKSMDILVNSINGKTKAIKSDFSFELNGDSVTSGFRKFATKMSSILKSIGSSKKTDFSLGNFVTNSFMKIRALASGGYVKPNTPQLALIGDNKHQGEVVAPENKLKEMAMEAVRAAGTGYNKEILDTLRLILQVIQAMDLNIVIDGKKLKDIIVAKINEQTKHTGVCEIIV